MENNKNKFWKGVLVGALVMAFIGLITVGLSAGIFLIGRTVIDNQVQTKQIEAEGNPEEDTIPDFDKINSKMGLIQQIISQYYLFEEDAEEVEDGIYMGMMYGLKDPYSVYYDEESYDALMEDTEGIYCGIGAMVSQNRSTGIMTIVRVFEGAPAYEAGMLPGDIIYEVGGENVTAMELEVVISDYIRGEENTYADITVLRGEDMDEVDLYVQRRQVEVPTVEYQMLENNVGYIYLMQFDLVTGAQFQAAIDELEQQGAKKLLIDLRDNPGGVLDAAVDVLAYLLPEDQHDGMLIYTKDKDEKGEQYFSKDGEIQFNSDYGTQSSQYPKKDGHQVDLPIAILVNGNSASAAEVFTGAMMDYDRATVVGTQTFGKGIVQNLIPLGDGSAIKLTTSHYYTPSGFDLHKVGLTPDVEVDLADELKTKAVVSLDEDNQVQKALEVLEDIN